MTTLGSDNHFPKLYLTNSGTAGTPAAGLGKLYVNASKILHYIDDTGLDVPLGTSLVDPMTTRGDVIIRNASNVTARLGRGTASQVLTSDGTDVAWATPASGFADPMTTRGDMIARVGANTTTRMAVGGTRTMLTANGTDPAWQAKPTAAAYKRTSGDYTTASTTVVDVDATNLALSITTLARRVLVGVVGTLQVPTAGGQVYFDIAVDGTDQGQTTGPVYGLYGTRVLTANYITQVGFTYMTDVLTAASHTFKLRWATTAAGTVILHGGSTNHAYMQMWVAETLFEV